jgi:antitoxin VapB
MDTPLVIDNEDAIRLTSALAALTGETLSVALVAALRERLEREQVIRWHDAQRRLGRAIAANLRQEGLHLARVPNHGWCRIAEGAPRG